jgi:hypothetical protein
VSIALQSLVWGSTLTDSTQVSVLSYLANCADDFGGNCYPGIPLLSKMARRSERTVIRALVELEAMGWLDIQRGSGRGIRSQFQINVARLKECQDVTLFKPRKKVTLAQQRVTSTHRKGDIGDNPPHPLIGRTVKEPSGKQTPPNPLASEGELQSEETDHAGKTKTQPSDLASNCVPICPGQCAVGRPEHAVRPEPAVGSKTGAADRRSAGRGSGCDPRIEAAVSKLMSAVGMTKRRDRRRVYAVIELEASRGEPPDEIAEKMISAIGKQDKARLRGELTSHYGVMNFLERGVWKTQGRWHWNEELLQQRSVAGAGSL